MPNVKNELMAVFCEHLKRSVIFVPRDLMRRKNPTRQFRVPFHLVAVRESVPVPPAVFSWSKNGEIDFPILGNDRYGCCYYSAVAHGSQCFAANSSGPVTFDEAKLIRRYLEISGGDNGLSDSQIMPEWQQGIIGPRGPHQILDEMNVDPTDAESVRVAMFYFTGLIYTAALLDSWLSNMRPGAVWDDAGRPNQSAGHAVFLTGVNAHGNYECQTWGFRPCVELTPAGMRKADPELIVAFSLDQFDKNGKHPSGLTYDQLASLWVTCGGNPLPPSPFPDPGPGPGPGPDPGDGDLILSRDFPAGTYRVVSVTEMAALHDMIEKLREALDLFDMRGEVRRMLPDSTVDRLPWAKIFQIVTVVIAFVAKGDTSPAAIAALIAAIRAILSV